MTGMAADMTDMTGPYRLPSELTETGHALLVHLGSLHFRYHADTLFSAALPAATVAPVHSPPNSNSSSPQLVIMHACFCSS